MSKVSNKDLWQFCLFYSKQFGAVIDKTVFLNELRLRYYHQTTDAQELYSRCIQRGLFVERLGNIIFQVDGRNR